MTLFEPNPSAASIRSRDRLVAHGVTRVSDWIAALPPDLPWPTTDVSTIEARLPFELGPKELKLELAVVTLPCVVELVQNRVLVGARIMRVDAPFASASQPARPACHRLA